MLPIPRLSESLKAQAWMGRICLEQPTEQPGEELPATLTVRSVERGSGHNPRVGDEYFDRHLFLRCCTQRASRVGAPTLIRPSTRVIPLGRHVAGTSQDPSLHNMMMEESLRDATKKHSDQYDGSAIAASTLRLR